jgi:thiol:disulfide interchange protein DsbC
LLGDKSRTIVSNLTCAKNQNAAKAQIFSKDFSTLEMDEGCDLNLITRRMLTAQILGVTALPYLIRDDGLISRGFPQLGLEAWLEG